jgi:hypothetical protein
MLKKLIFFISLFSFFLDAQNVGINSTGAPPDNSAGLDINFTNRGFLPPRVALTAANAAGPITLPATGLIVYNTATSGTGTNQVTPGLYYNHGTPASPLWLKFGGRMVFEAKATGGLTNYASTAWAIIPGTGINFTIPAGLTASAIVTGYIGANEPNNNNTDYAVVDMAVFINGALPTVNGAGFGRLTLDGRNINEFKSLKISQMDPSRFIQILKISFIVIFAGIMGYSIYIFAKYLLQ